MAVAILVSGGYLIYYFVDVTTQDIVINNVRATYELNRDDYSYNASGEFSKFEYLKKQNNDLSGWITIPGSEVDNPIYQTSDNEFYLNHDMNKAYNRYGTLYVDYRCNLHPASLTQNQIIYGHNMRYGAMFGTLDEYRKVEYYKTHPIIKLDTLYESRTYKIFAVMITNPSVDKTFGYEFSPYRVTFTSQEDFTTWVGHCKERSLIDTNIDVNEYDEVLTLSTCCYDFDDARLVVVARLVREGESADVDVSNAALNPDVLYSKEYYDKKKLPIPNITKD